ncbi:MAG: flippase-like domain-containing protein, partial [Anaerolineae bacterium]|nr:flippase-like domain-containing protein [Anaerolineae bacterium]
MVLMVFLALAFGSVPDAIRTAAAVSAPAAVLGFGMLVVLARKRAWTDRLLARVHQPTLTRWGNQLLDGLRPLAQMRSLVAAVGLTALGWGLSAAAGYCLMFTFYDQASWITTLLYIAAAAFAIAVPAVPGNLGPYELSIILALNAT